MRAAPGSSVDGISAVMVGNTDGLTLVAAAGATATVIPLPLEEQQIDDLGGVVDDLIGTELTADQAEDLVSKLDGATTKLDQGKPDQAIKKLDDFSKLIDQELKDGEVDPGVAEDLTDAAQDVIDTINAAP